MQTPWGHGACGPQGRGSGLAPFHYQHDTSTQISTSEREASTKPHTRRVVMENKSIPIGGYESGNRGRGRGRGKGRGRLQEPNIHHSLRQTQGVSVCVIGGGPAGLACCRKLCDLGGFKVTLVQESRGLGGKMCTKFPNGHDDASISFDMGVQFLDLRPPLLNHLQV